MNSKRKGNAGELELLRLLESHGLTVRRNDQRYTGGVDNPDLSCTVEGLPVHIECKRTEKLSLYEEIARRAISEGQRLRWQSVASTRPCAVGWPTKL